MITCDVLTGFLGSGKTTLLNAFLRTPEGAGTAVIVNEFGAIGLDQFLFKEVAENVFLLDSGCLCCTVTNSLAETLLEIKALSEKLEMSALRRVVIETTGLADPLPILHALLGDRMLKKYFSLGRVIVTVDALQGARQLREHRESLRQVAVAEHLVMTKTDQASAEDVSALRLMLMELNRNAEITESVAGQAAASIFAKHPTTAYVSRRLARGHFTQESSSPVHDSSVVSWSTYVDAEPTWVGISAWWNLLVHEYGDRLLRCKGLLRMGSAPPFVFFQGVGKVFHSPQLLPTWPDTDPRSRLVCIGSGLDARWLDSSLRALQITEPSCRPLHLHDLDHCF